MLHTWILRRSHVSKWILTLAVFFQLTAEVFGNISPKPGNFPLTIIWQENTPNGTIIGNMSAIDTDGPSELSFRTDTASTAELVVLKNNRKIDNTSRMVDIVLIAELDRDYAPNERKLYFIISDGSSEIPVRISLFILDVNDVAPQFTNLPYKATINESVAVGSVVFRGVRAFDPDNGLGASISFNMTTDAQAADDEYRTTFDISAYDGTITLRKKLDYEKHSFYQFKISARDGYNLQAVPADFLVTVLDVQDTEPYFVNLPYNVEINESIPVGSSIIQVAGLDGDRGIPNTLTYSFMDTYENFLLDFTTGWITVKNPLDRDTPSMASSGGVYAMFVKASENVPPGQVNFGNTTASTLVTITVKDVNDNGPVFTSSRYAAQILENMQTGVPVTFTVDVMRVSDADQGTNSHFLLTVEQNGRPYNAFTTLPQEVYSESSVLIRVNNSQLLDFEQNHQLIFQIVAREIDTAERRSSTATLTLNILDMNDNAPVFNQTSYVFQVDENIALNSSFGQIHAQDADSNNFGSVTYSIRGGSGKFRVDTSSGVLSVAGPLDREATSEYYLSAEAMDGGGLRTPAEIRIVVLDVNDNAPLFRRSDYEGVVRENDVAFLRPINVEAVDLDEPNTPNSRVQYAIIQTPSGLGSNFTINSSTGEITLVAPLNYEKLNTNLQGKISLQVSAFDAGTPQRSSLSFVNITVEDVNDFAPEFSQKSYSEHILENSPEGTKILKVTAHDQDGTSPNNDFFYRIDSGALDKFRIDFQTGDILVEVGALLDREERADYTLRISATDRGNPPLTGYCNVTIILDNINDELPVFAVSSDTIVVSENAGVGQSVVTLAAKDLDANSSLKYSVLSNQTRAFDENGKTINVTALGINFYFGIFANNGTLTVASRLDRERAERIVLQILVEDLNAEKPPQQSATEDYNDNAPVFIPRNQYSVSVSEGALIEAVVLRVETTDADKGQQVTYQIKNSSGDATGVESFKVDEISGTVFLKQRLDHESQASLTFLIVAKDSGVPQLTSTATVSVSVLDENDNAPEFLAYPSVFYVSEGVSAGYFIYNLTAVDRDSGDYGRVVYSLDGVDNDDQSFQIDPSTGRLTVAKGLDRETKKLYRLDVLARDSAPVVLDQKTKRSPITITITDVNDNAPQFEPIVSKPFRAAEILPVQSSVFTIKASDADDGLNGTVTYNLTSDTNATSQQGDKLFTIDENTGGVSVAQSLRGRAALYYVTVRAQDQGTPRQSTILLLFIEIYDVNDYPPTFVQPSPLNPVAVVTEGRPRGELVIVLKATDNDTGINGEVQYSLTKRVDATDWRYFDVDPVSGRLTTTEPLDRERQSRFELYIRASDKGVPSSLSSDMTLIIRVQDVNDQPPEFDRTTVPTPYPLHFREKESPQCANVSVAVDRDSELNFTIICYYLYGVEEQGAFHLDKGGQLCLQKTLDRESSPTINLVVQALADCYADSTPTVMEKSGASQPSRYDSLDKSLLWVKIEVDDVNDNKPIFARSDLALGITRTTQFGTFIFNLKDVVSDADTDKWGVDRFENLTEFVPQPAKLARDLADMGVNTPFILYTNGSIKTNTYFKADMSGYFTVSVIVFDRGGLNDTATFRISLINDNQRLKVVFRQPLDAVAAIRVVFAQRMSAVTGYRVVVDKIQTHENDNGVAEADKTDMLIHGEELETNNIVPADVLLRLIDQLSLQLVPILNDYNILKIVETSTSVPDDVQETKLKMALILVSVILGVVSVVLAIVLYLTYKKYTRKLKAATALAYANSGYGPTESDLYKADIPGTNMHSYENSNPIYLEKIMLEGDDEGRHSLDTHAMTTQDMLIFDEQEVSMNIFPEDQIPHSYSHDRMDAYLKAVINEHENSQNLKANDVDKDKADDKMLMSRSAPSPATTSTNSEIGMNGNYEKSNGVIAGLGPYHEDSSKVNGGHQLTDI